MTEKNFELMVKITVASLALAMAGMITAALIYLKKPEPQNYAVYPNGSIVPLISVSKELPAEKVTHFAASAILTGYRFDFRNYNQQLGQMNNFLSLEAYNSFMTAISPLLDNVKEKRMVCVSDIVEPTVIVKTALIDGVMKYKTSTVALITLDGQNSRIEPVRWVIETVITNVPLSVNPTGLQIERINAKPFIKG